MGAGLQPGISTEVPLALFQITLATQAIKFMSEQIAGKIGSHIKLAGGTELHLGHAGL